MTLNKKYISDELLKRREYLLQQRNYWLYKYISDRRKHPNNHTYQSEIEFDKCDMEYRLIERQIQKYFWKHFGKD